MTQEPQALSNANPPVNGKIWISYFAGTIAPRCPIYRTEATTRPGTHIGKNCCDCSLNFVRSCQGAPRKAKSTSPSASWFATRVTCFPTTWPIKATCVLMVCGTAIWPCRAKIDAWSYRKRQKMAKWLVSPRSVDFHPHHNGLRSISCGLVFVIICFSDIDCLFDFLWLPRHRLCENEICFLCQSCTIKCNLGYKLGGGSATFQCTDGVDYVDDTGIVCEGNDVDALLEDGCYLRWSFETLVFHVSISTIFCTSPGIFNLFSSWPNIRFENDLWSTYWSLSIGRNFELANKRSLCIV